MSKKKAASGEEELLNINQAANLLNVSKASLRRWTDSGKMPCYRVGAQQARRFRREDLVAFIGGEAKNPGLADGTVHSGNGGQPSPGQTQIAGMDIDYGHHVCAIYGRPAGRLKLSVPLLSEGLKAGDSCFLIASGAVRDEIIDALEKIYPEVKTAIQDGRLISPVCETNKDRMLDSLEEHFLTAGYGKNNLRLVGDMQWVLENGWGLQELYEYELEYNNTLGHRFPIISLCQYDAEVFSGKGVLDALKSHEDTYRYPIGQFCI